MSDPSRTDPTPAPPRAGPGDDDRPDATAVGPGPTDGDPAGDPTQDPDFGPSGYLPPRASARARKIVLRAPLGLQWVVGALLAGVAVLVAGILLLTSSGPPERPWVRTVAIDEVDGAVVAVDVDALVVTGGGPAMAFADQAGRELGWCGATRRVEGLADGQPATWQAGTGRGFGVRSLDSHPIVVHDGIVYVDPTRRRPGPRPTPDREGPTCR